MKVAPVSADLLIKLALVAAVVGGAVYLARRATAALGGVLPDVGAWVDSAGAFVGDIGSGISDGAGYVADNLGGTAHNTPISYDLGSAPAWNPYGVAMTPAQRQVYDETVARGTIFGDAWDWLARIGNQVPYTPPPPDPVQQIRRIDNALGY
jgi:hypothetical protein